MWARLHKLDRLKPLPGGGAIAIVEDERSVTQMQRVPSVSMLVAIARVLAARRVLEVKLDGKGEVRYCASAVPSFLSDAIVRAGASIAERDGERIVVPAQLASVGALIDVAFAELAHATRTGLGATDVASALHKLELRRRASPLDRDARPELYWPAVLELAALAGEQARGRGARWIDTRDLPVPFALRMGDGALAHPTTVAQKIVEGGAADETLASG